MSQYDYLEQANAFDMSKPSNHTPEEIAEALFNQEPKDPCTCQMLANPQEACTSHLFEILLIILVKGIEILSGDLTEIDLNNMTSDHIINLQPWIRSLGFSIVLEDLEKDDIESYEKYYCRILIKDKVNTILFEQRNFVNNYHFFLNGKYLEENENKTDLSDLYAIFRNNSTVFKIGFKFFIPPTPVETTPLL